MRESGGRWWLITNGVDRGLWQFNAHAWPNLSRAEALNPLFSSRFARYLSIEANYRAWGLRWNYRTGGITKDYRDYDWSVSRSDRLIWAPFRYWYRHYPARCS